MKSLFRLEYFFVISLMDFSLMDQFRKEVNWKAFEGVPKVIVAAEKESSEEASQWGHKLQAKFNAKSHPQKDHVHTLQPGEKVKIIAVASLPDVPNFFKGIFFKRFQKKHSHMGMLLDFDHRLSKGLGFKNLDKVPGIAILPPSSSKPVEPLLFYGLSSDADLKKIVFQTISEAIVKK
ncbi:hypothetical protein GW915_07185 [bacterium]|nr:hypothetical protein [bacterium]